MRVLLINGSPHPRGCTYTALRAVACAIEENGVSTEIYQIGTKPVSGCLGCGQCSKLHHCVIDDNVNEVVARMREADGLVIGSPVHYASPSGAIESFCDRLFTATPKDLLRHKPCAVVASARRAGTSATLDALAKYPTICEMPLVSSKYWNEVHGATPADVEKDEEGMQTMQVLGANMAYVLKCRRAAEQAGIEAPVPLENRVMTNFIR
ncbi:MAG: flavodoxin family protein [Atopobiaceae bacterium]|jgi:multimeric flavodoxin WrbA|nr:flavodoxin family protein [Atopobiaceae bacterium]